MSTEPGSGLTVPVMSSSFESEEPILDSGTDVANC
jgi:hypothetical protein